MLPTAFFRIIYYGKDSLISATAIAYGLVVVTRTVKASSVAGPGFSTHGWDKLKLLLYRDGSEAILKESLKVYIL